MRLQVTVTGAAEARNQIITLQEKYRGSKRPVLVRIADRLAESIRRRIEAGTFAAPSAVTLDMRRTRKRKPGSNSTRPLVDTGAMQASVRTFVSDTVAQAAADKFYAGFVQLGFTTSPKAAVPNRKVPGRPFMVLDPKDVEWATEQLLDYLMEAFDAAA